VFVVHRITLQSTGDGVFILSRRKRIKDSSRDHVPEIHRKAGKATIPPPTGRRFPDNPEAGTRAWILLNITTFPWAKEAAAMEPWSLQ
jgi:hypothetical protein